MTLNEKFKHRKERQQQQKKRPRRSERECKKANQCQAGFVDTKRPTPRRIAQCNKKSQAWLNDRRNLTFIAPLSLQTATIEIRFRARPGRRKRNNAQGRAGAPPNSIPTDPNSIPTDPNRSQPIPTDPNRSTQAPPPPAFNPRRAAPWTPCRSTLRCACRAPPIRRRQRRAPGS